MVLILSYRLKCNVFPLHFSFLPFLSIVSFFSSLSSPYFGFHFFSFYFSFLTSLFLFLSFLSFPDLLYSFSLLFLCWLHRNIHTYTYCGISCAYTVQQYSRYICLCVHNQNCLVAAFNFFKETPFFFEK